MLVIYFSDGADMSWHVGTTTPMHQLLAHTEGQHERQVIRTECEILSKIYMLQADGDELEYISRLYPDKGAAVPLASRSVVRWYGDIARTILLNL